MKKPNILQVLLFLRSGNSWCRKCDRQGILLSETDCHNYSEQFTDWALGLLVAALGPHCDKLGPVFHTKVPNKVNFALTEQSGAHRKHPKQVQEQSEIEMEKCGREVICGDPSSAVLEKISIGFK